MPKNSLIEAKHYFRQLPLLVFTSGLLFDLVQVQRYSVLILQDREEEVSTVSAHLGNADCQCFEVSLQSLPPAEQILFSLFRITKKLLAKSS